eukprot:582341-Lingulodinium_polyedra.AAC.1
MGGRYLGARLAVAARGALHMARHWEASQIDYVREGRDSGVAPLSVRRRRWSSSLRGRPRRPRGPR